MAELKKLINHFLIEGTKHINGKRSLAGEPVYVKVLSEKISRREIKTTYEVVGKTGQIYDTLNYHFTGVQNPYYYMEALKLALSVYWSGIYVSKKNIRRMEFLDRYGEANKVYLNRSLEKIFWLKTLLIFWKRSK